MEELLKDIKTVKKKQKLSRYTIKDLHLEPMNFTELSYKYSAYKLCYWCPLVLPIFLGELAEKILASNIAYSLQFCR